jgi:small-conductance mechanosensitive channel/ABC-type branched-subunit amino acid transport system substrate-binding protein
MDRWLAAMRGMSRWRLFGVFVGLTAILATLASALTYRYVLNDTNAAPLRIALIAPVSGDNAAIGAAMEAGARQALAKVRGVVSGHPIELTVIDEATPDAAEKAASDPDVVGVIGPYFGATAARIRPKAEAAGLATLSLAPPGPETGKAFFSVVPPADQEVRFLANYVRNVLGERLVSIILPDDPAAATLADQFDEVLQHFGTRVVYRWTVAANAPARDSLRAVAAEMNQKQIAGTVLLLGSPAFTAEALADLRQGNVPNRVIGLREMATQAFAQALNASWAADTTPGAGLNGTVVTTPMLFDTAGIKAQEFRSALITAGAGTPDWLAALSHDATAFLAEAIADLPETRREDATAIRKGMPAAIAAYNRPAHALSVLSGSMYFNGQAAASAPQLVGVYDGTALISSPIQLTPILEEGVSDYLEELKQGRALYVNDRFMYKTNVVYVGVQLEKVFQIDADNNIADAEFLIWFRWRGTLEPQAVVFPNAVAPIDLTKPERESKTGELNYRAYRARGKFFMNYSGAPHAYGTQVVDIVFRHRTLGTNNLRYVTDTLGLGLNDAGPAEAPPGFLARAFGTTPSGALARQMAASRVLAGVPGWLVDHAWLSQETLQATSRGDPVFVGFGKPAPVFSSIELGLIAKPDALDLQDAVPANWLVYGMIFAVFGAILAYVLDRKDRGSFWRMQTLVLRLITWPMLLMTGKALALAYAQVALSPSTTAFIDLAGSSAWWFIGGWLANIAVERFLWRPLEVSTERRVPTVFRAIVTILIFVIAGFGVVAFVLGRPITSLLASTGVLTFIVGMAIQSNLKDVFSGIMLNLERPFRIGDFLRINRNIGQVIDVSWRTTRIRLSAGPVLALPNGRLSDSEIENLSASDKNEANLTIPLNAAYPPAAVLASLEHAMNQVSADHRVKEMGLKEIARVGDDWVATYEVRCRVPTYPDIRPFRYEALRTIWSTLEAAGMPWTGPGGGHFIEAVETSHAGD